MTRSDLIHHPEAKAEREALLAACKADLRDLAPVWVAASGAAMPVWPRKSDE